jgi:hypothetical protein
MRRMVRWTTRLLVGCAALITLGVVGARWARGGYACLRYQSDGAIGEGLVDIHTNGRFGAARPITRRGFGNETITSPGGQFVAYLEPVMSGDGSVVSAFNLNVRPGLGMGTRVLYRHLPATYTHRIQWAGDGRSLAYSWTDESGSHWLAVSTVTGERVLVYASPGEAPTVHAVSRDGRQVLTTSVVPGVQREITLWAVDWERRTLTPTWRDAHDYDESLMYPSPFGYYQPGQDLDVQWSPAERWLRFTSIISGRSNQILFYAPESGVQHVFQTSEMPNTLSQGQYWSPEVYWSPDERYVAVTSATVNSLGMTTYSLTTYDLTSRTATPVTRLNLWMPMKPFWSDDGRTLYYFQLDESQGSYDLLAREISTGRDQALARTEVVHKIEVFDKRWACVPTLNSNARWFDLTGAQPPRWLADCTHAHRSPGGAYWVLHTAASGERGAPRRWQWVDSQTGVGGDLPIEDIARLEWSADGRWVAYSTAPRDPSGGNALNDADIFLLDTHTWRVTPVIRQVVVTFYLSPDARWVFTQRSTNGQGTIIIAATDGTRVYEAPFKSNWPVLTRPMYWSPDSMYLMYQHTLPDASRHLASASDVVDIVDTQARLRRRFTGLANFGWFSISPQGSPWTRCEAW